MPMDIFPLCRYIFRALVISLRKIASMTLQYIGKLKSLFSRLIRERTSLPAFHPLLYKAKAPLGNLERGFVQTSIADCDELAGYKYISIPEIKERTSKSHLTIIHFPLLSQSSSIVAFACIDSPYNHFCSFFFLLPVFSEHFLTFSNMGFSYHIQFTDVLTTSQRATLHEFHNACFNHNQL